MRAAVEHHLEPLGVEPDDEVFPMSDDGHADAAGQGTPLAQLEDILGDVRLFKLAAVFPEPILGQVAVGSSWRSVDLDVGHDRSSTAGVGTRG